MTTTGTKSAIDLTILNPRWYLALPGVVPAAVIAALIWGIGRAGKSLHDTAQWMNRRGGPVSRSILDWVQHKAKQERFA